MSDNRMGMKTIEECRRIDPLMRSDLESLDDEIRSIVARMSARAIQSGGDETKFSHATSTVLLSIAAALTGKSSQSYGHIDIAAFLARANSVAVWMNNRQSRQTLSKTFPEFNY